CTTKTTQEISDIYFSRSSENIHEWQGKVNVFIKNDTLFRNKNDYISINRLDFTVLTKQEIDSLNNFFNSISTSILKKYYGPKNTTEPFLNWELVFKKENEYYYSSIYRDENPNNLLPFYKFIWQKAQQDHNYRR